MSAEPDQIAAVSMNSVDATDAAKTLSKPPARFAFVDSLRGLAAVSIMIFHIWWYEPAPFVAISNRLVNDALLRTRGGVQILLVISGFVIAYTLRHVWGTWKETLLFLGRRLVRLVPAYWTAIAIAMLTDYSCRYFWDLPSAVDGHHSVPRTLAHMTFLQDIFDYDALSAGLWTLCIEMQFYIVAILGWTIAQRLFPRPDPTKPRPSAIGLLTVFAPLAFASLFHWRQIASNDHWVIHFLWMFFLGMLVWWTLDRTVPKWAFAAVVAIAGIELIFDAEWRYENSVALTTALVIFTGGYLQRLDVWLNWWPLQYLGRISYSLYLIHFPICHVISAIGWKWYADSPTPVQARLILFSALVVSMLAAQLMYVLVEAPSARWAAMLKRYETAPTPPAAAAS